MNARPVILAIDDTPSNLLLLGAALADDFDLQIATSGPQGLTLIAASPPDLILLDVMMPEMDGFEVCRRLKNDPRARDIPVVFLTAMSESYAESAGLALGAADYITKPINVEIARLRIFNLIERERLHQLVRTQRDQLSSLLSERQQTDEELRIAAVAFASQNGMVITDAQGHVLRVNPAFTRLTGYSGEDVIGRNLALLQSGRHDPSFYQRMWGTLHEKGYWQGEVWNKRKNGQVYAEMLSITAIVAPDGHATHYVGSFSDITEDKKVEAEIHRLAYYDPLTRLPNRRLLQDRLGQAIAASARSHLVGGLFLPRSGQFQGAQRHPRTQRRRPLAG